MYLMKQRGEFEELTDIEKLREIRTLIEGIDRPDVTIVSDHIVNLVGSLNHPIREKNRMLQKIDEVLNLPEREQKRYQLARAARYRGGIFPYGIGSSAAAGPSRQNGILI